MPGPRPAALNPDLAPLDLLILGASARAAAASAVRAGFRPVAVDLFADRDLRALARADRVEPSRYPEGLADRAEAAPPGPWIYTGGLENRPELVDRIAARRSLLGNPGDVLRAVRDPLAVARVLGEAGLPRPEARLDSDSIPGDGSWLVKPIASAGGQGIRAWTVNSEPPSRPVYYQERIAGPSYAAVFARCWRGTRLLGLTRQWIGRPEAPFAYAGSLGPIRPSPPLRERIAAIGRLVGWEFGLLGLFGIDLVVRNGVAWPVEVNPRYTASVEVLELGLGRPLLTVHAAAFGVQPRVQVRHAPAPRPRYVGKAIVYARGPGRFPEVPFRAVSVFEVPRLADLPEPGTPFHRGEPLLSLLESGETADACRRRLARRMRYWHHRLGGQAESPPD